MSAQSPRWGFVRCFVRHKSTQGYWPAKYPCIMLYAIVIILLLIPGTYPLAALLALLVFVREEASEYLALHAVQDCILLLLFAVVGLIVTVKADWILNHILQSGSEAAYIKSYASRELWLNGIKGGRFALVLWQFIEAVLAYNYRWFRIPGLGYVAEKIVGRHFGR